MECKPAGQRTAPPRVPMTETSIISLDALNRASWEASGHPIPSLDEVSRSLLAYLRDRLGDSGIGYTAPPERIPGGTDTLIYRFRLGGVPAGLDEPLVLRLYAFAHGTGRAVRESRVQKALARTGFPVPDVHFTCTDRPILGGAFFIMQCLPGASMSSAPIETIPALLCKAHLALHRIDPGPVVESLRALGESVPPHRPEEELAGMAERARGYPCLAPIIGWMSEHLPPPPPRLAICHGDFHPLNIMVRGGEVTGVLDWTDFMVADPIADVACTLTLGIPARHLVSRSLGRRPWDRYLECYRREVPVDPLVLDYYRTRRCLVALLAGARGRVMWRHPAIALDVIADLRSLTGVALAAPPWEA